ncbi:unnamed protein product [Ceutorhynchus assimilis]|uniref:Uncharacterized protein n=1 Tax=Ceutorhynchus assimilis TaxID=467358 RepID=A0A9P0DD78_9CUCU|nr:unnamed protein product [Ceutorhynchus assimilis]
MVMDQFVTTYRKDYLWPYVRTLGVRPYNEPKDRLTPCECRGLSDSKRYADPVAQMLGPHAYEGESWSRLGPMGPLLDPKVYPAKMSAAPESQLSRYDQPNVFLAKLQEKYPFIYECLRTAPPDDILARINRDRLRTTYQVDYCKMNEYPSAPYDEILRAAGVDGLPLCQQSVNLPGDSCPIYSTSRMSTPNKGGQPCGSIYKSKEAAYCVGSCRGPFTTMTSGATEYQDAISRLGQLIIRDKIHDPTVKRSIFAKY